MNILCLIFCCLMTSAPTSMFENRWTALARCRGSRGVSVLRHILLRPPESGAEALARISGFPREIHSSVRPASALSLFL